MKERRKRNPQNEIDKKKNLERNLNLPCFVGRQKPQAPPPFSWPLLLQPTLDLINDPQCVITVENSSFIFWNIVFLCVLVGRPPRRRWQNKRTSGGGGEGGSRSRRRRQQVVEDGSHVGLGREHHLGDALVDVEDHDLSSSSSWKKKRKTVSFSFFSQPNPIDTRNRKEKGPSPIKTE